MRNLVAIAAGLGLIGCGPAATSDPFGEVPRRDAPLHAWSQDGGVWTGRLGALAVRVDERLRLGPVEVGVTCVGRVSACTPRQTARSLSDRNRLLIQRAGVDEWFVNDAAGLEQGFVLRTQPPGSGALRVAFAVNGPVVQRADGLELSATGHAGSVTVRDARAWDREGKDLPTRMFAVDGGFALEVDDRGASYPVTIDPTYLSAEKILVPPAGVAGEGAAGYSVALDAKGAVTGVKGANAGAGAAYVWTRSTTGAWSVLQTLTPSPVSKSFGAAVASDVDTLVVGAPDHDEAGKLAVGAAFVFVRGTAGTFTQQAKLLTSDGLAGDRGAAFVSISGDTIAVGSRTSAYVFVRAGTTWTEQAKLAGWKSGLAVSGNRLVVGDNGVTTGGSGKMVLYERTGTVWSGGATMMPTGAKAMDSFADRLAMDGDIIVAGGRWRTDTARVESGTAWIFERQATGVWTNTSIAPASLVPSDHFGDAVAVKGTRIAIGATGSGATYVLEKGTTGVFAERDRLLPSVGKAGVAVGVTDLAVASTSPTYDATGKVDVGCAFVFEYDLTRANGVACVANKECTSGVCADGLCCDRACAGCEACTAGLKGSGANGTCGPVSADTDPHATCAPDGKTCGADGMCDGTGKCRSFAKAGVPCGATTCAAGSVTGKTCLGSAATCVDATTSCAPYACGPTACRATCLTEAECAAGAFCTSTGTCVDKKAIGADCGAAKECASGFCVDGACCNAACTGSCEACNVAATRGTCTPVAAPVGARPACPGGTGVCAGGCDGKSGACTFPIGKECANACDSFEETVGRCDAAGTCKLTAPVSCGAYACDAKRCRTACVDDTHCAAKHRCVAGVCQPSDGRCSADGLSVIDAAGATASCSPARCRNGACIPACKASDDCAVGFACTVDTGRCDPVASSVADGGCDVGRPGAPWGAWATGVMALMALGSRTRKRVARGGRR